MLRKILIVSTLVLASSGMAFAQTGAGSPDAGTNATNDASGDAAKKGMLDDPVKMKPFYTDDSMTSMRSMDEMRAAMKEVNEEDKAKITEECKNVTTQRSSFCKAFNDANQM